MRSVGDRHGRPDGANHVERIYMKLGVTNRAAATMRAAQHGLVAAGAAPGG